MTLLVKILFMSYIVLMLVGIYVYSTRLVELKLKKIKGDVYK